MKFKIFIVLIYQLLNIVAMNCEDAGCKSDSECRLTQTCLNRECTDTCPLKKCGVNSFCSTKNHRPVCSCPPGYRPDPDPYIRCKRFECLTDSECPTTRACQNEQCVDPCKCARNADCFTRNHTGICICYPGYTGDPYGIACEPIIEEDLGCQMDKECPSKQACIISGGRGECKNPCTTFQPCVQNAECKVYDSLPLRTMTCTCIEGFTGKGDQLCQKIIEAQPQCYTNSECLNSEVCNQGSCLDACRLTVCGTNARCSSSNHIATCHCLHGFEGDPLSACYAFTPSSEVILPGWCSNDSECPDRTACENRLCINPCAFKNPCAPTAICQVINHQAVCSCPNGYKGSPTTSCLLSGCQSHSECPLTQACLNEECVEPCSIEIEICGGNSLCSVENHAITCTCYPGFTGDPFGIQCDPIPEPALTEDLG